MRRILPLALLIPLVGCGGHESSPDPAERPNIVVLLLDTVRADRLGCYGSSRARTPHIDALADESLLFLDCSSVSAWTLPAHASMFTGVLPVAHLATQESLRLGDEFPTLAQLLGGAGYQTYGASANAVVGPANGLDRGFAHFEELYRPEVEEAHRREGLHPHTTALESWLAARDAKEPYFAFLNYIEAHAPYRPPQPFFQAALPSNLSPQEALSRGRARTRDHYLREGGLHQSTLDALSALYDGEVAYLDWAVGQIVALLRERGELDRTLLVITADHGEAFGEHGHLAHSFSLYQELLHVPLMLRLPGAERGGERNGVPVSLLDLFPTLMARAGADFPARVDGRDLLGSLPSDRPLYAEYYYPAQVLSTYSDELLAEHAARFAPFMRRLRAVRLGRDKLIQGSDGREESYRLDLDPAERSSRESVRQLLELLANYEREYVGPRPPSPTPPPGWRGEGFESTTQDPRLLEQLRALGYID